MVKRGEDEQKETSLRQLKGLILKAQLVFILMRIHLQMNLIKFEIIKLPFLMFPAKVPVEDYDEEIV